MPSKPLLAIGLLLIGIMASAGAQTPPAEPELTHFANEIESIQLPEHRKWYTVLVTSDGKPSAIADWFAEDARLADLKQRTEWRHYSSKSQMFTAHLKPEYGSDYPLLVIQDQDGAMRAQLGGTQLQLIENPDQLVTALNIAADTLRPIEQRKMGGWLFNRNRPAPNVCPGPNCPLPPAPEPPPEDPPAEIKKPVDPPAAKNTPIADAAIAIFGPQVAPWANGFNLKESALAAAIVGGAWFWKRRQAKKATR